MLCRWVLWGLWGLSMALRAQLRTAQDIHGGGGGTDFSEPSPWGRTSDEEIDTNLRRMTTKTAHDVLIMAPHARPPILGMCSEEPAEPVTKGPHSHGLCSLFNQTLKPPVAQSPSSTLSMCWTEAWRSRWPFQGALCRRQCAQSHFHTKWEWTGQPFTTHFT